MNDIGYCNWNIALFADGSRLSTKEIAMGEERMSDMDSEICSIDGVFPGFYKIMDDF